MSSGARAYHSPRRAAAAARTRTAVLGAAKPRFERSGWAGTTTRSVAADAGVSPKTVEALFGTKASLLRAVVDFAIRGDDQPVPVRRRSATLAMERAGDAGAMLDMHAAMVREIAERSAEIAWVVEQAALSDRQVGELWTAMTENRRAGVRWAARTLLAKPGVAPGLTRREAENVFWVAIDWNTYRALTRNRGMSAARFEAWIRRYYRRLLLA